MKIFDIVSEDVTALNTQPKLGKLPHEEVESVIHQPGPDGTNFVKVSWGAAVRESSGVIPMLADVSFRHKMPQVPTLLLFQWAAFGGPLK